MYFTIAPKRIENHTKIELVLIVKPLRIKLLTWTNGSASTLSSRIVGRIGAFKLAWVGFPIRTHIEVPGYGGSCSLYLCTIGGGTNLPPKKWWGPRNLFAQSFGAVKETYTIDN